jgi:hypothetical protein
MCDSFGPASQIFNHMLVKTKCDSLNPTSQVIWFGGEVAVVLLLLLLLVVVGRIIVSGPDPFWEVVGRIIVCGSDLFWRLKACSEYNWVFYNVPIEVCVTRVTMPTSQYLATRKILKIQNILKN